MEKNNLPGLTPIVIILLATALAVLLVVGVPYVFKDDIRPADWIGFAGNIVASAVALVAAMIAWRAVQRQIQAQAEIAERQIAGQRLILLQERLALLEDDDRLAWTIKSAAATIGFLGSVYLSSQNVTDAECIKADEEFEKYREQFEATLDSFRAAGARIAPLNVGRVERSAIPVNCSQLNKDVIGARRSLITTRQSMARVSAVTWPNPNINLTPAVIGVETACDRYIQMLATEQARVIQLLKGAAKTVGL